MQCLTRMSRAVLATMALSLLSGCMGLSHVPRAERDPIYGLGQSAARLIAGQSWSPPLEQQVVLLAPPVIEEGLDASSGALNEAMTRALLALKDGPQVINWNKDRPGIDSNQWRLEVTLESSGGALTLSDRTLQPYQLKLILVRSTSDERDDTRTLTLSGAFDQAALDTMSHAQSAP